MMKASINIRKKLCNIAILAAFTAVMLAICILPASALTCDSDMYVNETGWWNASFEFNASNTSIQHAIDNATAGNTIYVYNGSYRENVNVDKRLTLRGEGADVVKVTAKSTSDHVIEVTVDYVNISGFNVTGATSYKKAGIYLSSVDHCNLSDNTANSNIHGIYMSSSSNNTLTNNTADLNDLGIYLGSSNNNTLTSNTANSNYGSRGDIGGNGYGIYLFSSRNNTLTSNTANSNNGGYSMKHSGAGYGIYLSSSSNNMLTSNTANSNYGGDGWKEIGAGYGIYLSSSSNNTLMSNTANSNYGGYSMMGSRAGAGYGIRLYLSSNNTLMSNTANSNYGGDGDTKVGDGYGICLASSSNNTLTSNTANSNYGGEGANEVGDGYGISLNSSSNNMLTSNTANSNYGGEGLLEVGDGYGIGLNSSSSNTLYQNIMYKNSNYNAYDNTANNNWNSSTLGNYYADINAVDSDGNGINDTSYGISGSGGAIDNYPLVVASKVSSPATSSGSGTFSFTVSTTLIDHASVGIENYTLYYSTDNSNWTKYANSTAGTFTFFTTSVGDYYFYTNATDTYGIIEGKPPTYDSKTTVSITTTSSSSSNGGIGIGTSDEPENVEETVVLRIYLRAGDSSTYNFNNVVTSIEVTPGRTYGLVVAKIEVLHGQPGSITTDLPPGVLYKYVNIFIGTSGWAEGRLSDLMINFQVPTSWCEENNIDPASVVMYRHHECEWQPLRTTMTGLEGEYYQYSSPTPGFSTFVILGQVEESGTVKPVATADSGTVADPTPEATSTSTKGTPGFGILLGIMGILFTVYLRRK